MTTPSESAGGEILVYEAADGSVRVDVRLERDTVWLTQRQMSELFESSTDNIGLHLKNIFSDNELQESATTEDFSVVQSEGGRRSTLREHLVRGYTLNRQRLEQNARELESALALVRKTASSEALTSDQGRGLMIRLVMNMLAGPAASAGLVNPS